MIFGPLVWPRTSALTFTLASMSASTVTVSPSTKRTAGNETDSPSTDETRSISMTSPTATFCCWPPLRTIAYTTGLLPHLVKTHGRVVDAQNSGTKTHRRFSLRSVTLSRQNGTARGARIRRVCASCGSLGRCFWVIGTHLLGLRCRRRSLGGRCWGLVIGLLLAPLAPARIVIAASIVIAAGSVVSAAAATVTTLTAVVAVLRLDRLVPDHHSPAVAVVAVLAEGFHQAGANTLARHLDQAERGHLGNLVPRTVPARAFDKSTQDK